MSFLFIKSGFTHRKRRRKREGGLGEIAGTRRTAYCTINTYTTQCHTHVHTHAEAEAEDKGRNLLVLRQLVEIFLFLFSLCVPFPFSRALTSRQRVCVASVPVCMCVCETTGQCCHRRRMSTKDKPFILFIHCCLCLPACASPSLSRTPSLPPSL